MTPVALFGLGILELIVLGVVGLGFMVVVVGVVVLVVALTKPKGPTND